MVLRSSEKLPVRAATNFAFVNEHGEHVSVGPGPGPSSQIFLVAACGSLNMQTEGGQRLAAGWWNSDPDPERMNMKAPAEITWLKIPVRYICTEQGLWLRDE